MVEMMGEAKERATQAGLLCAVKKAGGQSDASRWRAAQTRQRLRRLIWPVSESVSQ